MAQWFDFFSRRLMDKMIGTPPPEKKIPIDYSTKTLDIAKMAQDDADAKLGKKPPASATKLKPKPKPRTVTVGDMMQSVDK